MIPFRRIAAVLWAAAYSGLLAIMWVLVRQLSDRIHPLEITFFGTCFGFFFFLTSVVRYGFGIFQTHRIGLHISRGVINGGAILAWFVAITLVPLADAAALNLLAPLVVSIGAVLFLNEPMGPRRWFALALGLAGALVVVRPGFVDVGIGVGLVMITVVASAIQRLIAKTLAPTDSGGTCVLYLTLFMIPVTLAPALFVWTWPGLSDYPILLVIGALLSAAHFSLSKSLQLADVSALGPVNFTRLVWGAFFGYLFFAEAPSIWTWIGGLIIVSATTYVARREAVLKVASVN